MLLKYIRYLYHKYFCTSLEACVIERINSNETFVIYLSDNDSDIDSDIDDKA
jgi:hypothetical protein